MINNQKRFLISAATLLGIVIFVSQTLFFTVFEAHKFPLRVICILVVWLATCASYLWVMKTVTDNPKAFNMVFMSQTAIRLMIYLALIVGYMFIFRQHAVSFTLHFFAVYLCFATFEVLSIMKFIKENSRK